MNKQYERAINDAEKITLKKQMEERKSESLKNVKFVVILIFLLLAFPFFVWASANIYFDVFIIIFSLLIAFQTYHEVKAILEHPKAIRKQKIILKDGIAIVNQTNIDRYLEIWGFDNRIDFYVIEYQKNLRLIKGEEFYGRKMLSDCVEIIKILTPKNRELYNEEINFLGNYIEPYYRFDANISKEIFDTALWNDLMKRKSIPGNLNQFDAFEFKKDIISQIKIE